MKKISVSFVTYDDVSSRDIDDLMDFVDDLFQTKILQVSVFDLESGENEAIVTKKRGVCDVKS